MSITAEEIARQLGRGKESKLGDGGWKTVCPAHDDKAASMTVRDVRGKILVRCHANCTQEAIIEALKDRDLWPRTERKASWSPVTPVPEGVEHPKDVKHSKLGKPVRRWTYLDSKDRLIGFIYRFEDATGKTLLPMSYCKSDSGEFAWMFKSFEKPRPLYGLDRLAKRPDAKVAVFEGEKAADAAQQLFPNYVCISWPGGSKAVKYTDVKELRGRDVTLWPDADEPGLECMERLSEILITETATKSKLVQLPEGLPKGWDVADAMPQGIELDLVAMLEGAIVHEPVGDKIIAQFNKRYAFILVGGRGAILRETIDKTTGKVDVTYITPEGFRQYYANNFVTVGRKDVQAGSYWFTHEERRTYEGITFSPGRDVPGYYNLWRGFSFEPDPTGDWSIFREHLYENAASGNEEHYNWILAWFAQMCQKPWEKVGTSLSFRGPQGTGKTIVGKVMGRLFHQHYTLVDDTRYVFGQFNSHMASTILLHSDEGFWGGDPKHVGKLRSMVTSDTQRIEHKGRDSIEVPNYMRMLITTNQNWVVPAAFEERRFAVFDMGDGKKQERTYFIEMLRQLRDGGYGGLLYELLNYDLKQVDIGQIPSTKALRDQKETSMSDVAKFWFVCLMDAEILPGQAMGWPDEVFAHRLYEVFIEHLISWGVRYRPTSLEFYKELRQIIPPNTMEQVRRMSGGKRTWCYLLPNLDLARQFFDKLNNTKFDWPNENGPIEPARSDFSEEIPF